MKCQLTFAMSLLGALSLPGYAQELPISELLASAEPVTQTEWAARYEHGEGVERNYDHAVQLYCIAGWEGNLDAQYQLGWLYANGRGMDRNDELAADWFALAAAQGDTHASKMLSQVGGGTAPPGEARCVRPSGEEVFQLPRGESVEEDRAIIERLVRRIAPRYKLAPELVLALIQVESNFNPDAHSPKDAQGLMQLIPATARRFGVENIKNPLQNLHGGMAYLRWLLDYFEDDLTLALAGYNAGEGAVKKYNGIPPYRETQHYVKAVFRLYQEPAESSGA